MVSKFTHVMLEIDEDTKDDADLFREAKIQKFVRDYDTKE